MYVHMQHVFICVYMHVCVCDRETTANQKVLHVHNQDTKSSTISEQ